MAVINQGFTYLCGCFASVISTTKAVSGLKHLSKEYQRELLNAIYINLENCGKLLDVHLTGTENSLLKMYLICIDEKLKINFGISIKVSRPLLRKKLSVDEVINQIKRYSEMPDTAVLIGLEDKYSHWTTVTRLRVQSSSLTADILNKFRYATFHKFTKSARMTCILSKRECVNE